MPAIDKGTVQSRRCLYLWSPPTKGTNVQPYRPGTAVQLVKQHSMFAYLPLGTQGIVYDVHVAKNLNRVAFYYDGRWVYQSFDPKHLRVIDHGPPQKGDNMDTACNQCDGDHRLFTLSVQENPSMIVSPEEGDLHIGTSKLAGRYKELAEFLNEGESVVLTTATDTRILLKRKA